jgi:TRAP-type C4-dicarboxylate transport system substrate-binding protein
MKQKIRWLLFHQPVELFIRTAEHFEEEVNRLTGNKYEFEIMPLEDYEDKYCNGQPVDPVQELKAGRVDICQLHSSLFPLYNATDFAVFDLPFLFSSHDHATRVFEGSIGNRMLNHVEDTVEVKGLGFTYSGGYMCWKSDRPITSLKQLQEMKISHRHHPIGNECFKELGVQIVEDLNEENICMSTLPRFHVDGKPSQNHCVDTGHSMYLTMIFMNQTLWSSFDAQTQAHFKEAALICARAEREKSVADAELIKSDLIVQSQRNIESIAKLPDAEQEKLKNLYLKVRDRWKDYFPTNLVDDILTA